MALLLARASAAAELEAQLDMAQASVDEIGRVLAAVKNPSAAEKECRAETLPVSRVPAAALAALPALRDGLASHLACKALEADDPTLCAPLESPAGPAQGLPAHYLCGRDYRTWAFDRSRLGDGKDFTKRCLEENSYRWPGDEGPFRPDGWKAACAALEEHRAGRDDAAKTCAKIGPLFAPPVAEAECERRVRWFFAEDPALCDGLRSEVVRARCREIAAFKAKPAARDCGPALETAKAAWCGRFNRDYAWKLHSDLSVLLEKASDLMGREAVRGGPEHPLAEKLRRLETRRQDLASALGVGGSAEALPGAEFSSVDIDLAQATLDADVGSCDLSSATERTKPLEDYFACQARVLGSPTACKVLDLPAFKNVSYPPAYRCRHNFLMWNADVARLSGTPDSPLRCIAENYYRWRDPFDGGPFKPGAFREGCGIIADYSVRGADLKATCEKAMAVYRYSTDVGECVNRFRYAHGQDLKLCTTIKNPPVKLDRCQGLYALRHALREGASCGDSMYCRMQTERTPQTCGAYGEVVRKLGCGGKPSPELVDRAERKLNELKGAAVEDMERRRAFIAWLRTRVSAGTP